MKLKVAHLTQLFLLALPALARGFGLARPAIRPRSLTALAYNDGQTAEETATAARAKDCIEHFGECSIEELQDLKSGESFLCKKDMSTSVILTRVAWVCHWFSLVGRKQAIS